MTTEWGIRYTSEFSMTMQGPKEHVHVMVSENSARLTLEYRVGIGRHENATLVKREVSEWEEAT